MAINYNGNASNVSGQTQVTVSNPQDGDSFTASEDTARTNTLADWMQSALAFDLALFSTTNTWTVLQTFTGGIANVGPTTIGSFSNSYTAGPIAPRYWKDASGVVHLDGTITRATATRAVAFNLPAGFRPVPSIIYLLGALATTELGASVLITSAGDVTISIPSNGDIVSLVGLSFATF